MPRTLLALTDPRLRRKSFPVEIFSGELADLCYDLLALLRTKPDAIGLAAPQVGVFSRVFVIDKTISPSGAEIFVNPLILHREGKDSIREGCLSVPGIMAHVPRAEKVIVQAQDLQGQPFTLTAHGPFAILMQHEIDHLDGILFIDRLSRLKRKLAFQGARV